MADSAAAEAPFEAFDPVNGLGPDYSAPETDSAGNPVPSGDILGRMPAAGAGSQVSTGSGQGSAAPTPQPGVKCPLNALNTATLKEFSTNQTSWWEVFSEAWQVMTEHSYKGLLPVVS